MKNTFLTGTFPFSGYSVPSVSTDYKTEDFFGAVMVRWGINRNNYRVSPGLYAIGSPDSSSDVFVTANYKLSFDHLRRNLSGVNCWVLVLDTKGINVWCAAGKGTFGTDELVKRINIVSLGNIVTHKRIILPQLGAPGVAAHKVKEETGFNVHYGPVRASDIKKYVSDGYRAGREMRKISFGLVERIKLIPNDFIYGKNYLLIAFAVVFLVSLLGGEGNLFNVRIINGLKAILNIFLAYFSGIIITPLLLPYLPGHRFSFKGFISGLAVALILFFVTAFMGQNLFEKISWFLIIPAISSFMAMNFTGSSTYTSLSGVKKEMKTAMPLQIIFCVSGVILLIISMFVK